jgi:hypothetical protein
MARIRTFRFCIRGIRGKNPDEKPGICVIKFGSYYGCETCAIIGSYSSGLTAMNPILPNQAKSNQIKPEAAQCGSREKEQDALKVLWLCGFREFWRPFQGPFGMKPI